MQLSIQSDDWYKEDVLLEVDWVMCKYIDTCSSLVSTRHCCGKRSGVQFQLTLQISLWVIIIATLWWFLRAAPR